MNGKLPKGARLTTTEAISNLDGGLAYDIKILDADGNEWQPTQTVTVTIPVSGVEDGEYIELVHFLESAQQIREAIAAGNVLTDDWVSEYLPAASAAYLALTGEEDTVAFEVFELQVADGKITFNPESFSVYTWNGSSFSKTSTGDTDKIVFVATLTQGSANGSTYYVTPGQTIRCDRGGTGAVKRQWQTSHNNSTWAYNTNNVPISQTSGNSMEDGSGAEIEFTVDSTAAIGATFWIKARVRQYLRWDESVVKFVVVEERPVHFTDSKFNTSVSSLTAVTDGGSRNQPVTLPTLSKTGYNFLGWKLNDTGTTYAPGSSYMPASGGLRFYAQWEPIKYTVKFHANGGSNSVTGSMPTLNMTYDVETTLPRNQFINQGDGMVFLGWATSADGEVVYKDGAKIKNLTATNNGTVTLYAKWKYGLASTVYIGINNTYHNPKGTYTAGGVTIDSYHTYPNEPAQMTGDFDRVTDTSGGWTYNSESAVPLKNQAASYINGNIFNSPDYEMTYVEGENTLGIADPTGGAVRAMLKFSDADYQAMIAAWLNGMRSTLTGYGDTSVAWQNAKPEDFVMVPYVIKFQNYDSWYIDMVVKPKALYTLAYDGNIENGYTASFTGVAFPPSAQHTEGTNVSVVSTPIGYQTNNLKVTKVVDGHTYTAEFQYWYDAKGNTYGGSTGRNTITLTEDTILYAKWNYPDASFGNLNITKTVVDRDAYEDPSATQAFMFKFTTSASGSYSYTIYDRTANVKASGTIVNNGTFTLQDGWRIRITDLPKGATYTVTETAVNYYTASGTVSGTISAGATTYATVTNTYQKNAGYTVKHYLQNEDKTGYTEQTADQQNLYGVVGQSTSAQVKTYSGYSTKPFDQQTIHADGSTVISIYYDLISTATVIWKNWNGAVLETDENVAAGTKPEYNGQTPVREGNAQYSYTFDKWTPNVTAVTGDVTYTATFTQTVNQYTLSVEWATPAHGSSISPAESVTVSYGEQAKITYRTKDGYRITHTTVNGQENPNSQLIMEESYTADPLTEDIKIIAYTAPIDFTITYDLSGGTLPDGVTTNTQTYTIEQQVTLMKVPTKTGYKFTGWKLTEVFGAYGNWENGTFHAEKNFTDKYGFVTFEAQWELALVDLTITTTSADQEQSFIFTVSGIPSDSSYGTIALDVVLVGTDSITIKDLPVGEYTVTEKNDWSWREEAVESKTADLKTTSQTVHFDFGDVDNLHWLSGYSYKCKKGGS